MVRTAFLCALLGLPTTGADPPGDTYIALDVVLPQGYEADDFVVVAVPEPLFDGAIAASRRWLDVGTLGKLEKGRPLRAALDYRPVRADEPLRLHVESLDRLYQATAAVAPGALEEPVKLEFVLCGRVELTTTDYLGRDPEPGPDNVIGGYSNVDFLVYPLESTTRHPLRFETVPPDRTILGPLLPGKYRVEVHAQRLVSAELFWEVRAGETLEQRLVLERLPDLAPLSIQTTNETEAKIEHASVHLQGVQAPHREFYAETVTGWGCFVYDAVFAAPEFMLPGVPAGEYFVETRSREPLLWPVRTRLDSTAGRLELVALAESTPGFRMSLRSGAGNRPIEEALLLSPTADPLFPLPLLVRSGSLLAPAELRRAEFDWLLHELDHVPLHGDETAFVPVGDDFVAEVVLEKGWGACLWAETERGEPLAGAEVRADGTLLGKTDASGHAHLSATARPEKLHVTAAGWSMVDGDVHPTSGRFHRAARLRVVFAAR